MVKKRILLVDDYKPWRNGVKEVLEEAGFDVTAFSALAAAKAADIRLFDGFVVDRSIEVTDDGVEWAEELVRKGHRVVVCSSGYVPPGLPQVEKINFSAEKIRRVLGI